MFKATFGKSIICSKSNLPSPYGGLAPEQTPTWARKLISSHLLTGYSNILIQSYNIWVICLITTINVFSLYILTFGTNKPHNPNIKSKKKCLGYESHQHQKQSSNIQTHYTCNQVWLMLGQFLLSPVGYMSCLGTNRVDQTFYPIYWYNTTDKTKKILLNNFLRYCILV